MTPGVSALPLPESEYQAIEATVMETARGRWFLAEYAHRHRAADTDHLLAAISRLESVAPAVDFERRIAVILAIVAKARRSLEPRGRTAAPDDAVTRAGDSLQGTDELRSTAEWLQALDHGQIVDRLEGKADDRANAVGDTRQTMARLADTAACLRTAEDNLKALAGMTTYEPTVPPVRPRGPALVLVHPDRS